MAPMESRPFKEIKMKKRNIPPFRNVQAKSVITDCLQDVVFFGKSRSIKEGELSQVPVSLGTLSAEKDHIFDNPQNACIDTSAVLPEASTPLNARSGWICNLDDCLRLLKALSDFLAEGSKPLGGCLNGCTVNVLVLLIATVGLITGHYWLLTAVLLPMLTKHLL
jgi:hypothetical protein